MQVKRALFLVESLIVGAMCLGTFGMAFWDAGSKLLAIIG